MLRSAMWCKVVAGQRPRAPKHVITYRSLREGNTVLETRRFTKHAGQLAMHPRLSKQCVRVLCGGGHKDVARKSQYVGETLNNFGKMKYVI